MDFLIADTFTDSLAKLTGEEKKISRPFGRHKSGCIAVKVNYHLGGEVMKVFRV